MLISQWKLWVDIMITLNAIFVHLHIGIYLLSDIYAMKNCLLVDVYLLTLLYFAILDMLWHKVHIKDIFSYRIIIMFNWEWDWKVIFLFISCSMVDNMKLWHWRGSFTTKTIAAKHPEIKRQSPSWNIIEYTLQINKELAFICQQNTIYIYNNGLIILHLIVLFSPSYNYHS